MVLRAPKPAEENPLLLTDLPLPEPGILPGAILHKSKIRLTQYDIVVVPFGQTLKFGIRPLEEMT